MATINLRGNEISYGLGFFVALLVLIVCVVFAAIGHAVTPTAILCMIGALALSRLI